MEVQIQELSKKHTNNIKLLRQVRAKQMRCRREIATSKAEVDELAKQGDRPVYKSVGKVFFLSTRDEQIEEAKATLKEREQDYQKYDKQTEFLMAQVKQNEKQMSELMVAQQQGAAQRR